MTFDTTIIGSGLSGLIAGIALQKRGQRVAIAAYGQSTLGSFSGSFDLLGYDAEGAPLSHPLDAIGSLRSDHPYLKIGTERVAALAEEAKTLLAEAGLVLKGDVATNHSRITPMGVAKPAWLSLDDCFTLDIDDQITDLRVQLVGIEGFLDFPAEFICAELERQGARVSFNTLPITYFKGKRKSPYETRATSIARLMDRDDELRDFAAAVAITAEGSDVVVLPAVFGLATNDAMLKLRQIVGKPTYVIATLPPSLLGARVHTLLRNHFTELGGTIFYDTKITSGTLEGDKVVSVSSGYAEAITASHYILATGSFQSHGLVAEYRQVVEPLFRLDVSYDKSRTQWTNPDLFAPQPYMAYGVITDAHFQPYRSGIVVRNLYAIGSVLCGHDALAQADGTGVSLLSALAVANHICNGK